MPSNQEHDLRALLLTIVEEQARAQSQFGPDLTATAVLEEAVKRLNCRQNGELSLALLTQWHELFRTGYLSPGLNLSNPDTPFFHITSQGKQALAQLSRDPGNPGGYLRHIYSVATLSDITKSYLEEGLQCYVAGLYKAGAVMVGGAAESIVLELRDALLAKLNSLGRAAPKALADWRMKTILDALKSFFDKEIPNFPGELKEEYGGYWSAFTQQVRASRNDAGHPSSVAPVAPETIHASLLIFPELAKLANKLQAWIANMT